MKHDSKKEILIFFRIIIFSFVINYVIFIMSIVRNKKINSYRNKTLIDAKLSYERTSEEKQKHCIKFYDNLRVIKIKSKKHIEIYKILPKIFEIVSGENGYIFTKKNEFLLIIFLNSNLRDVDWFEIFKNLE